MRVSVLLTGLFLLFCQSEVSAQGASMDKEQIEKWSQYYQGRASEYKISVVDGVTVEPLTMVPTPVLRWHNPIRTTTHGECFVWTSKDGRLRAFASIFSYPVKKGGRLVAHEINPFGSKMLTVEHDDKKVWRASPAIIEKMTPVPGSPLVAATPAFRLVQMRGIARKFSAESRGTEKEEPRRLRLLTSPLYRYAQDENTKVDGALFTFAMGTDPEILILVESFDDGSTSKWRFAAAQHAHTSLVLRYDETEVWSFTRGERAPSYHAKHGIDHQPRLLP